MLDVGCFPFLALVVATLLFSATAGFSQPSPARSTALSPRNISLSNELQRTIDRGTEWLKKHQDPKGFWSTPDHPALTAFALVALLGGRPDQAKPSSDDITKRGYDFVLSCVQPDGGIHTGKGYANYNTATSIMGLLAAQRAELKPVILKARQYLIGTQIDLGEIGKIDDPLDGGVGYGSQYQHSDMGNTLFALEAIYYSRQLAQDENLTAARDLNWEAAIHFLQNCQNLPSHNRQAWVSDDPQNRGGFIYYPGNSMAGPTNLSSGRVALRSYGSISYGGMLSYAYAQLKRDDPRVAAVFDWLRDNYTLEENPGLGPQGLFFYVHTMTKALNLYGIDELETKDGRKVKWREEVALKLMNLQQADGSWVNANARWWENDPVLVTSYAVISLKMIQNRL